MSLSSILETTSLDVRGFTIRIQWKQDEQGRWIANGENFAVRSRGQTRESALNAFKTTVSLVTGEKL